MSGLFLAFSLLVLPPWQDKMRAKHLCSVFTADHRLKEDQLLGKKKDTCLRCDMLNSGTRVGRRAFPILRALYDLLLEVCASRFHLER